MSTFRFYPYATAPERVRLSVDPVSEEYPATADGTLLFHEARVDPVRLEVSVVVPGAVLEDVLPPHEQADPPTRVLLLCRSTESRQRFAWPLEGRRVLTREVEFRRQDWAGGVELQAVLVRDRDGSSPGYGAERGSLLAWSEVRRLLFDANSSPAGDFLDVEWRSFPEDPGFRAHSDHLFALDTALARPRLVLNSAVGGAPQIFESTGTHGPAARIRDAAFHLIAHQVWSSLLSTALAGLARASVSSPDRGEESLLGELEAWQRSILTEWAPALLPDVPAMDARRLLTASIHQVEFLEDLLLRRLPTAVQSRVQPHRSFDGLLREFMRREH